MLNAFGLKVRLRRGGTFVASKAKVWPETLAGRRSPAGAYFGKRYGMVAQPVSAGLTAQLTGRAENGLCNRSRNARICLCCDPNGPEASGRALPVRGCQVWGTVPG
jgi:hypothetical protein